MPKIDIINCDFESITKTYLFAPSMGKKSIIAGNISVFKDLVNCQLRLDKDDPSFRKIYAIL